MALYVFDAKKAKKFVPLSDESIKRMKRVDEARALSREINDNVAPTIRALVAWLEQVDKKGRQINKTDLAVTRLPNRQRLLKMVDDLTTKMEAVQR